ncbi:Phosphotransferase enzyme family-domain-containing protein [Mycena kentingensis (nom. inval.)]|nr:Phosphotransferase enzyme family-domain-containing protein [Mycena kentingensis (nom. inval.)]
MSLDSHLDQDGLAWDDTGLQLFPRWTREPSLAAIVFVCRRELQLAPDAECKISFFAAGAFNKLYLVTTESSTLLMRVSLPVYPHYKTRGEVATLGWVREHTQIPVPKVLASQDNRINAGASEDELDFEWMLMERMPGQPLYKVWRNLSMQQKVALVEQLAGFQAQLHANSQLGFSGIGTLQPGATPSPGRVVSHEFFMGDHVQYDVPRGPFRSSRDWMHSQLQILILAQSAARDRAEDDDDREEAEEMLECAEKLLGILPKVFPEEASERTVIWHDDLDTQNILVDDEGRITGIIDWECVSAFPLWMATRLPAFLDGQSERTEEPVRDTYADAAADEEPEDGLDNEGKNMLYWIHLMEYEVTKLKGVYEAKMRELWPNHEKVAQENAKKVDFYEALLQLTAGIWLGQVAEWAEKVEQGESVRWADV